MFDLLILAAAGTMTQPVNLVLEGKGEHARLLVIGKALCRSPPAMNSRLAAAMGTILSRAAPDAPSRTFQRDSLGARSDGPCQRPVR